MTIYVDNFRVQAQVGLITARWSHLIADTREELHVFARSIGLRREWFQEPKSIGGRPPVPGSYHAESWHYDVTDSKRRLAITKGARAIDWKDLPEVIKARIAQQKVPTMSNADNDDRKS